MSGDLHLHENCANGIEYPCQVCGLPAVASDNKRGYPIIMACQACRKFYLRNRLKDVNSLRCINGTGNCIVDKTTATAIGSGVMWRMACPRCRFAKCLAIGLGEKVRQEGEANLQTNHSNGVGEIVLTSECSETEAALQEIVTATLQLSLAYESSPLTKQVQKIENQEIAWKKFRIQNYYIAEKIGAFAKCVPGYKKLTVEQQRLFLENAGHSLTLAVSNRSSSNPCTMSSSNADQFLQFFPEFEFARSFSFVLWMAIANWKPSCIEYPCLLAILLYQSFSDEEQYNSAEPGPLRDVGLVVHASLMHSCRENVAAFNERFQSLLNVAKVFRAAAKSRQEAIVEAMQRRPHLLLLNDTSKQECRGS